MRLALFFVMLISLFVLPQAWANDGDKKCIECHEVEQTSHAQSLHGKAWALKGDTTLSCSSCHGDGARHNAQKEPTSDTIIAFSKKSTQTPGEQNNQCLNCHKTQSEVSNWKMGKHANNNVRCVDCHSNHDGIKKMGIQDIEPKTKACLNCHNEQKLQSKAYSHHPIIEGKVSCNDCHNPHGTLNDHNLRAETVNALCYKCHTDKRGPYLWEHPPVEENCLNCHVSHGSNHLRLLKKSAPNLCQECHNWSNHPSTPRDANSGFGNSATTSFSPHYVGRGCLNCHTKVHGSIGPQDTGASPKASGKRFTR